VERAEIEHIAEGMVKLAIATYHGENVVRLSDLASEVAEVKARIIAIDGNGTGREGAVQRLEGTQRRMDGKLDALLSKESETKGALGLRQRLVAFIIAIGLACIGVGGVILGEWVKHKMGW
jgi:hypothetical protein